MFENQACVQECNHMLQPRPVVFLPKYIHIHTNVCVCCKESKRTIWMLLMLVP